MTEGIPARTHKGREVLLDRDIELDTKLRTVLAQCDGKRDAAQIKARFGAMIDVDTALRVLLEQGLVEVASAAGSAAVQPASVLQAALGAAVQRPSAPTVAAAPSVAESAPPAEAAPTAAEPEDDPFAEWFPPSMRRSA